MKKVKVQFLEEYRPLFDKQWRYIIFHGGRYSGKSYHVALALLLRARSKRLRILCTREVQMSIRDSVHKLLKDLIEKYGFRDYKITDNAIINLLTKSEFIFKGLRHNITDIKSTEGVDICWIEEGQVITDESLDILTPTIRKPGSQIIITFNRFTELDPVFVRYVQNPLPKSYVKQVNYDVLEKVGLLSDSIQLEIEHDRNNNPSLYAHKWLGEPLSQADNAVLNRNDLLRAMEKNEATEGIVEIGVDVARHGDDRSVLWKRQGLKTLGFEVYNDKKTTELCDLIEQFVNFEKSIVIKVDDTGVGGGVTDELLKRGYDVIPINFGGSALDKDKYPNLISEAWFSFAERVADIELPKNQDLLLELSTRLWKQDVHGKRCIESKTEYKKRGFRSPDLADACIICYYDRQLVDEDDIDII